MGRLKCITPVLKMSGTQYCPSIRTTLGLDAAATYTMRDVWRAKDEGSTKGAWTDPAVPAHGVTFVVLSPAK